MFAIKERHIVLISVFVFEKRVVGEVDRARHIDRRVKFLIDAGKKFAVKWNPLSADIEVGSHRDL
ncbi:hypothetical protein WJ03_22975 [Burkholderia vietnamiensis]|nr:hypothetical protein WJ03_22975 [Burkholderia vietnamiensis]